MWAIPARMESEDPSSSVCFLIIGNAEQSCFASVWVEANVSNKLLSLSNPSEIASISKEQYSPDLEFWTSKLDQNTRPLQFVPVPGGISSCGAGQSQSQRIVDF